MSDHGQGTQIHVTPNCVFNVEAVLQNFYRNRTKKVTNRDTHFSTTLAEIYSQVNKKSGETSALGYRGDLTHP